MIPQDLRSPDNVNKIFSLFFYIMSLLRSCPWVIDQFRKSEYTSNIWGKCRDILVLTVFNSSRTRYLL